MVIFIYMKDIFIIILTYVKDNKKITYSIQFFSFDKIIKKQKFKVSYATNCRC